jgi:hypothetical protein
LTAVRSYSCTDAFKLTDPILCFLKA